MLCFYSVLFDLRWVGVVVVYSCSRFFFVKQKTAYELRISDWSSDVCSADLKFDEIIRQAKELGLAASVYTETSDVEGELNGLLTYDRAVSKLSAEDFAEIAKPLFEDK